MSKYKIVKVAAAQISPIFPFNKEETIDKVIRYVEEASANNAELIVFPECFIPAYPNWNLDFDHPNRWEEELADFTVNCINIDRGDLEPLQSAAQENNLTIVIGVNEIVSNYDGIIYNSLVTIDHEGKIINVHRKLFPTQREKMFHKRGDNVGLNILDTNVGRLGGLICYEHLQPLVKYSLISQGEQIHCASWPGWPDFENGRSNKGIIETASKSYALEGQCFVIASSFYVPEEEKEKVNLGDAHWNYFGGSGIISPSGEYIAGPLYDEEGILYADLDFELIVKRKSTVDTTGKDTYPEGINLVVKEQTRTN